MVRLAFCVDAQGMAAQARLAQSSGHSSLDEAALECVVKKAQPLPESSRGGCFVAPILFGVQ
jgi:TonB family protein